MNDSVRNRAWQLVKSGDATSFAHACSILSRRAGKKRRSNDRKAARVAHIQSQWWNK